jgi:hypothetical protein
VLGGVATLVSISDGMRISSEFEVHGYKLVGIVSSDEEEEEMDGVVER